MMYASHISNHNSELAIFCKMNFLTANIKIILAMTIGREVTMAKAKKQQVAQ